MNLSRRCGRLPALPLALTGGACLLAISAVLLRAAVPTPTPAPNPTAPPPPFFIPPPTTIAAANQEAQAPAPTESPAKPPAPPAAATPKPPRVKPYGGPKFLGAPSCSSSLCHGGGGEGRDAFTIWKKSDPHEHASAVLTSERAARIAQGLMLAAAAQSTRCTVCHTPLQTVPEDRLAATVNASTEGVSCESCHGPAQNWLRSHTRRDFSHAQNVQTGVRDLNNLYVRANACVACHQVLEPELLAAGHPPLFFELDAQTVGEPRHWIDRGDYFGPRAWLVGQAVALRETSWALSQTAEPLAEMREQWRALVWLVQRATDAYGGDLPKFDVANATDLSPGNVARAQAVVDDLARAAAPLEWSRASTRRCLNALAGTRQEFVPAAGGESAAALQNRAQRLVLALSRLLAPLQAQDATAWNAASQELDKLFQLADATSTFDGAAFANQLQRFANALAPAEK